MRYKIKKKVNGSWIEICQCKSVNKAVDKAKNIFNSDPTHEVIVTDSHDGGRTVREFDRIVNEYRLAMYCIGLSYLFVEGRSLQELLERANQELNYIRENSASIIDRFWLDGRYTHDFFSVTVVIYRFIPPLYQDFFGEDYKIRVRPTVDDTTSWIRFGF